MTQKQQVFWLIVGTVVAAAIGSVVTHWLSRPSGPSANNIVYTLTSRRLPTDMCEKFRENDFQQPECMIIALNLVNPSIEEIGPYAVKIDFKSVTSRPLTKKDMVEVSGSGNFVSSDLSIKATTEFQRELTVERMPRFATVVVTAILGGSYYSEPNLVGDQRVNLINGAETEKDKDWGLLFFVGLVGFLILPTLAAVAAFFQWLARDTPSPVKIDHSMPDVKDA